MGTVGEAPCAQRVSAVARVCVCVCECVRVCACVNASV